MQSEMASRSLFQMIEQPINMDGSISKDFQLIGHAAHHIGEQMYSELMLSFDIGKIFQYLAVVAAIYLINMDGSISKDFQLIGHAAHHIGEQMYSELMLSFAIGKIFQYLAVVAAIYLFVMDRTNWRTNLLTGLLVPYIALNLPDFILQYVRSEIGAWIAFVALVIRLFFPTYIPPHSELPATLILLLVTAPKLIIKTCFELPGELVSIAIGFYLLYEHIIHAGGFKKAFAERGVVITIGILLLFVAPVWQLVVGLIHYF